MAQDRQLTTCKETLLKLFNTA